MRAHFKKLTALFLGAMLLATAQAETAVHVVHKEPLQQMRMSHATSYGGATLNRQAAVDGELVRALRFDALGQSFVIDLEENRTILGPASRAKSDDRYRVYRGTIAGMPTSWARLVIADGLPRGMLWNGLEFLAIEVVPNAVSGTGEAVIYRLKDVQIPAGAMACGELSGVRNAAELARAVVSEVSVNAAASGGATSQIDVAVIGDFEFTFQNGPGTELAIAERMNNVDGIFSMQLGVQINIGEPETYPLNNDPFSDASDAGNLLDELADYRRDTPQQYANGLTHLFTGRDLDDNTVGVAFTGALCSRGFGAGLTQGSIDVALDSLIAAHEIGHNFGAIHDGVEAPCEDVPETFLMAPMLNGSSEFSACSITSMQEDVSRASCITSVPVVDVAAVTSGQPVVVLLGNDETLTFEANSIGSEDASGVTVNVTVPSGVTLNAASATSGSCASGAGNVSCDIGQVPAGSGATVSLSISASSVGDFEFQASVSADSDADSSNDEAELQLTVDPAVDLVATAGSTAEIALNSSTTITATVENRAAIAATGVTLTISPQAGLRVDSASFPSGSCSIAANVATCQASSLAPQSNIALQLGVTGESAGLRTYTITASATEADRVPADNVASGEVSVSPPPGSAGDSGGGSLGWTALLCLLLTSLLTARAQYSRRLARRGGSALR